LVKWREEEEITGDWIVDKSRQILDVIYYSRKGRRILIESDNKIQTYYDLILPAEHIQCGTDYLRDSAQDFYNNIPMWLGQPKYVEVWVEKSAMGSVVHSILKDIQIVVAPNGGWSSYTFVKDNLSRLLEQQQKGKDIYIQYYGDSDPSGERMTAEDSKLVKLLKENSIHFERIAINENIIKDFKMENLLEITDPKVLKKLQDDPNYDWFIRKHHGLIWQIEVDALQLNIDKFKTLVLSNVKKHFDESIYKKVVKKIKNEYPVEEINDELRKQIKELANELGMTVL
jgi:hypothetical protein